MLFSLAVFQAIHLLQCGFKIVDFYSTNLTHTYVNNLPYGVNLNAGASIGNLGLFGGGYGANSFGTSGKYINTVYTYTSNLVRTEIAALSVARRSLAAAANNGYVLFAGGDIGSNTCTNVVDVYEYYT